MFAKWVTINIASQATGYSQHALRAKIKNGILKMGCHWNKAPDGRIVFNIKNLEAWMEQAWIGS